MKNRYERMTRKEKKELKQEYKNTKKDLYTRVRRVYFLSVFGFLYAILSFSYDYLSDHVGVSSYIINGFLLLFCIYLFWSINSLYKKELNKFAIQKHVNKEEKQEIKKKTRKK